MIDKRGAAFARLFEAVHEGVYIGTIGPESTSTLAVNPHLKLIFGYPSETPEGDVRPFDRDRFVDPQARVALVERLTTDYSVSDYLLRLRRADGSALWIELTAHADPIGDDGSLRIEALLRDVSERKKLDDETRDIYHQLLQAENMAAQAMSSANGRGVMVLRTWQDPQQEAIILEINDDGPGIPDDVQPKIFDPFFTTKEVGKGTGLGLTVAYAIVQEHGGRIRLESRPKGGASFFVELPVSGKFSAAISPRPTTPARVVVGASVLLVEDESPLATAVMDALAHEGSVPACA